MKKKLFSWPLYQSFRIMLSRKKIIFPWRRSICVLCVYHVRAYAFFALETLLFLWQKNIFTQFKIVNVAFKRKSFWYSILKKVRKLDQLIKLNPKHESEGHVMSFMVVTVLKCCLVWPSSWHVIYLKEKSKWPSFMLQDGYLLA